MALEMWLFPNWYSSEKGYPERMSQRRARTSAVHVQSELFNVKREGEDITGHDLLHKFLIDCLHER